LIEAVNTMLPTAIDDILLQAMAVEKHDRYGSIVEFRNDLRDLLEQL